MLVGSGTQPKTYVALCTLDGREVLFARGKEQTEIMQRVRWHAPEFVGKRVFLRVVDQDKRQPWDQQNEPDHKYAFDKRLGIRKPKFRLDRRQELADYRYLHKGFRFSDP